MKKYFFISLITSLFFMGCVKDESPVVAPTPPAENYNDIVINELITKDTTDVYFTDESGGAADWVELYNKGNKAVNIAGMFITDAAGNEAEYQEIPSADAGVTTIPPKGFMVLICGAKDAGGTKIPTQIKDGKIFIEMGLSAAKDNTVAIYNPAKEAIDESADFSGLADDKSFGRKTDGTGDWDVLASKTPGAPNDGSEPVAGSLVINEFMASNDSWAIPGEDASATFPDWVEIYNTGDTPIDMGGWYATDALDDIVKYQLPTDKPDLTTVPAHGYLILMCDGLGEGLHTNFKLSGGGEAIGISEDGVTFEGYEYCDTGCDLQNPGTDNSTGRDGDGNATWKVFEKGSSSEPTPGASNN
jgi:hypothetical protein